MACGFRLRRIELRKNFVAATAVVSLLSVSCGLWAQAVPPDVKAAMASIDGEKIRAHVRFLADDLLEGRGPGLRGSELAAKYIATQFALYGLKPGGDNGTYLQQVNFVGMKAIPEKTTMSLVPKRGEGISIGLFSIDLKYGDDFTVSNRTLTPVVEIDAPIVFVGYGITAPEFGWDDYAGVDVKGKVVLCIVGDPPSDDPKFFGGKALTYYGRWTYKFEQAARMGAVGALIIHRTDLASYGWDVVRNSNTSEKTYLRDDKDPQLQAASWIQLDVAKQLFAAAGKNVDAEMTGAGKRGFKAVELPVRLHARVESVVRPFQSPNVVGILPGTMKGPDQAVLYTAHFDHLGFVPGMAGDNIYNGAADNATGCGMLIEMARAWTQSGVKPPHSVIFASVTAEEQGLLGSEYLGQHPPIPAGQISLGINYDMILPIGVPQQVNVNGAQRMSFYPVVQDTAKRFGLEVVPDPRPEAGTFYRSDHFSLSRVGIPAFSVDPGELFEGHDAAWGRAKLDAFVEHDYHNFSDNYREDWDFRGNAKLDQFGMELGWEALTAPKRIEWNPGDEFEAARKASGR
jgi:Zn-dependent M28 family amino/carboxypeptidase